MKITTAVIIDSRSGSMRKDGSYPVVIRIYKDGRQAYLGTDIFSTSDGIIERDDEGQVLLKKTKYIGSVRRANHRVNAVLQDAREKIQRLIDQGNIKRLSVAQIKKHILSGADSVSLTQYLQRIIKELEQQDRVGTAEAYRNAIRFLTKYFKDDVSFDELNTTTLQQLEVKYIAAGKSYNGLSAYLRSIRATYNRAIKEELIEENIYPFKRYSIKSKPTTKRALPVEHLKLLKKYTPANDGQQLALDVFFFSFYMTGLAFIDICRIKKNMITEGRLVSSRQKSGKGFNVKINKEAEDILNRYIEDKNPDDYVFPVMQRGASEADNSSKVKLATRNLNRRLQHIAKQCGVNKHITLYTARHTYATLARNKGVDIATISELLRHSSIKTTQIYLDSLSSDTLDKANDDITDF